MKAIELRDKDNATLLKYIKEREHDVSSFRMQVATGVIASFVAAFCFAAASLLGVRGLMYALGGLAAP